MKKVLIIIAAIFLILTVPTLGHQELSADFADPNLEALIRAEINKPEGKLLISDLNSITILEAENMAIELLDGLENLSGLTILNLRGNQITTIEPLSHLPNLTILDLRDNTIEDISPLAVLPNLTFLNLRENNIEDLTPLEDMENLIALNIRDNQIKDITAISTLTSLRDLNVRNNLIEDISPLAQLPNLLRRLYISGNPIRDLRPVREYYHLIGSTDFQLNIPDPEYSVFSGFYPGPFDLELATQTDSVIFFTLDGSEPSPGAVNTMVYSGPISVVSRAGVANTISGIRTTFNRYPGPPISEVFKATVVRAQTYKDNQPTSPIVTHTYFIGEDILSKYSLPVISIVTSPENLFSDTTGIYVPGDKYVKNNLWTGNYFGKGEEWERPAHLEYFEPSGSFCFSQDMGIRIHGGITRSWPQKSLRLYAHSQDGQSRFNYQVFPNQEDDQFKRLLLRNSGNDIRLTFFRDALIHTLIQDYTLLDTQDYQPAIVFINGEYWGLHNIRERLDDHYLARKYDVEREQVQIVKVAGTHNHSYSRLLWDKNTTMSKLSTTITQPQVYAHINTLMDVDNYIDYMIIQIYVANTDWPRNNMRYWRLITEEYLPDAPYGLDGRWRWMVYDTDYGLGLAEKPDHNTLKWAEERDDLFRLLLNNETFCTLFVEKFTYHINTTFNPERVLSVIDEFQTTLAPEMAEHINRWPVIDSVETWEENIDTIRAFAIARPQHMLRHLQKRFNLSP